MPFLGGRTDYRSVYLSNITGERKKKDVNARKKKGRSVGPKKKEVQRCAGRGRGRTGKEPSRFPPDGEKEIADDRSKEYTSWSQNHEHLRRGR